MDAAACTTATQGQWPRERFALASSADCGNTWTYLMDAELWPGNDARFSQMNLHVIDDYIWLSVASDQRNPVRDDSLRPASRPSASRFVRVRVMDASFTYEAVTVRSAEHRPAVGGLRRKRDEKG